MRRFLLLVLGVMGLPACWAAVDGTDWLALGGWADDEGAEDAGAVALVPVPR